MFRRPLAHLRGNVVAYLALFVALSGTAVAATRLPANSVGTKQLRNRAVTGSKVARNTLTGANIKVATLGTVPNAAKLGGISPSALQSRITGACSGNSAVSQVSATGGVSCHPTGTGTVTGVSAGSGLTGGGTSGNVSLSVDPTAVQARVTGACAPGSAVAAVAQDGTVTCSAPAYSEGHDGFGQTVASANLVGFPVVDLANDVTHTSDGTVFTVTTPGTYEVSVTLIPQSDMTVPFAVLTISSGLHNFTLPVAAAHAPATTTRLVPMTAGDTVAVENASPSSVTLVPGSTLELLRVGP